MKTFTLYGADSKVGVTMTAQAAAESFSIRYPEEKILLLHLDGNTGFEYSSEGQFGSSIDDMKAALISGVLKGPELEATCKNNANLYELKGVRDYSKRKEYYPEHVKQILTIANFDICIIDAGANFEMGLTIGSLLYSNHNYLITTQQPTSLSRFRDIYNQILSKLEISFDLLIINKYISSLKLDNDDAIEEKYNIHSSISIPMLDFSLQAEIEKESLLNFKSEPYRKSLDALVDAMALSAGYEKTVIHKKFLSKWIGGGIR